MERQRAAVVGSGVAGLMAAYILQRRYDVTLFEADERPGGHAHTHELTDPDGRRQHVDTGFIVHNERTYPMLRRLFNELGVATQPSQMSMAISCGGCGLEYAGGRGIGGLLPSVRTATRPQYLLMLASVRRFHRRAQALLASEESTMTLGEFLAQERFTPYFIAHFITPLVSAVWSCAPEVASDYPARHLFAFLQNHGMLQVTGSPQWLTVSGGSQRYVERVAATLSSVQLRTPITSLRRSGGAVLLTTGAGAERSFTKAVVATHPAQALALLARPTEGERALLGAFQYSVNPTQLHSDTSVLPRSPRAQASWNYYLPNCSGTPNTVQVSYNMNILQRLEGSARYVVSLNSERRVAPSTVLATMHYEHPIFTTESVRAQRLLPTLNDGTIAFAGAYHGWGFHEDGARAGVAAAESLGVTW